MNMKKILAIILSLAMILSFTACGESKEAETSNAVAFEEVKGVTIPNFEVSVNGIVVSNNEMAEYPLYSSQVTTTNSSGTTTTVTYIGFVMTDVLAAANLTEDYIYVLAAADDGYEIEFTEDVDMSTMLLAITKDGSQFKSAPWFAPCASETTGDYLQGCVSILVNTVAEKPAIESAEVNNEGSEIAAPDKQDKTEKVTFDAYSFLVNGNAVTNADLEGLSIYKITCSATNSKGVTSESTYTGYVLSDVLERLGISASSVKAVANDGYETELSADAIASEYTLIAIEKDKELGEDGTIWLAPCEETSSGSYCKLVVEIKAE